MGFYHIEGIESRVKWGLICHFLPEQWKNNRKQWKRTIDLLSRTMPLSRQQWWWRHTPPLHWGGARRWRPSPPKMKNDAIKLKIGTETNFGAGNSNLTMKKSETQPFDHAHAPPHQNRKATQSSWKLVRRLILVWGNQIWQWKNLKINPSTTPTPHPAKIENLPNRAENWYVD